jgi:hypothetical protein
MKSITTELTQGLCLISNPNSRTQGSTQTVLKRHQTVRSTPQRDVELKHQARGRQEIHLGTKPVSLKAQ